MILSARLCVCVCLHSDVGEAARRPIHHFPPWPVVPSKGCRTVTVTLGSFWSRKMVHPPPASPSLPPPCSSQPASVNAAVTHCQIYLSYPWAHIANQSQHYIEGPLFVHSRLEELLQGGLSPSTTLPTPQPLLDNLGKGEGRESDRGHQGRVENAF